MGGAVDDALMLLAANAMRPRVIDERMSVGELGLTDQREPVYRALGALAGLLHVQVVTRYARAERDAYRLVFARMCERYPAIRDMKSLRTLALHADVIDARIVGDGNFGHRVCKICLVLQRHKIFDHSDRAARFGHDEA